MSWMFLLGVVGFVSAGLENTETSASHADVQINHKSSHLGGLRLGNVLIGVKECTSLMSSFLGLFH